MAAGVGGLERSAVAGVGGLVVLSMGWGDGGVSSIGSTATAFPRSGSSGRSNTTCCQVVGQEAVTSLGVTREFMTGMSMGATMGVTTGTAEEREVMGAPHAGKLGQGDGTRELSPFLGDSCAMLVTLVQGSGRLTLEMVEVAVIHVFNEGCNRPIGFNPT